jgi:hypothetical protein
MMCRQSPAEVLVENRAKLSANSILPVAQVRFLEPFPTGGKTMKPTDQLRKALAKIAEVASAAMDSGENLKDRDYLGAEPGCVLKSLPKRLLVTAAETATKINPVNAPAFGPMATVADDFQVTEPLHIAVITSKYWGPTPRQLTVSFMESTPADLKARIIAHMNAWTQTGCISFVGTNGTGNVRISRGPGGYYSYLGTDILHIPANRQTMNLEGFSMNTPESEYHRVVRHETGHTLGFPHEHMRKALVARIDPQKAYRWFLQTYGWDKATVDAQVLTPLDEASLFGTPVDQDSIMCYQLPGQITTDGQPIRGGTDIDETDYAFCGKIYPRSDRVDEGQQEDWSEAEDVEVPV